MALFLRVTPEGSQRFTPNPSVRVLPESTGPVGFAVEYGDGYARYGNIIRLFRPYELKPEKAEAVAVKKVAKRLGVSKQAAQRAVSVAQRELGTHVNYLRAAALATSREVRDLYTREEIGEMRDYWSAVVRQTEDMQEDDDIMALLS